MRSQTLTHSVEPQQIRVDLFFTKVHETINFIVVWENGKKRNVE